MKIRNNMKLLNLILSRRSVREFTEKNIDEAAIIKILKAGMAAPSEMDRRLWEFVIINEREKLDLLGNKLPYAKMLKKADIAISVCGDVTKMPANRGEDYWVQDCSAATQNILLAAHSLGLGAVWTAVYPSEERVTIVKNTLKIPDKIIPLNIIPIGFPADNQKPKDKWNPEKIHYNYW